MSISLVLEIPMTAVTGVEVGPRIAIEMTEDIEREA